MLVTTSPASARLQTARTLSHAPAPATPVDAFSASVPVVPAQAGTLHKFVKAAVKIPLSVGGVVIGTAVGLTIGAPIGTALGGSMGYLGKSSGFLEFFQPMQNIAGIGGTFVHEKAEKFVGKIAGARVGNFVGRALGAVVGATTGSLIGTIAVGWAGLDAGMRAGQRLAARLVGPEGNQQPKAGEKSYEEGWDKLQIPVPDGKIDPTSHHHFFIKYGLEALKNDALKDPSHQKAANFMASDPNYAHMFEMGAWDMDTFEGEQAPGVALSTFHHFREPFMPGFKSAAWQARQCYDRAADAWKAGDRTLAIYYAGAALHPVQDMSLPQHAVKGVGFVGKMLGHQMMETYMENHGDNYQCTEGEYLPQATCIEDFVEHVGSRSASRYKDALKEAVEYTKDPANYQPNIYKQYWLDGERITTGVIEFFLNDMEKQGYPI